MRFRCSVSWEWGQWIIGAYIDPDVLYSGDDSPMRAFDIDAFLLCLHVLLRWEWPSRGGHPDMPTPKELAVAWNEFSVLGEQPPND